jgi:hypothetical protein
MYVAAVVGGGDDESKHRSCKKNCLDAENNKVTYIYMYRYI